MVAFGSAAPPVSVGGRPALTLTAPEAAVPSFTSAEILPGRGMNTFQLRAKIPGKGIVELFHAPPLNAATMAGEANESFKVGGAILVPFANRIRGKLLGKNLRTSINGKDLELPANWKGKLKTAEAHAMHGLILDAKFDAFQSDATRARGVYQAGGFKGHWPSETEVSITTWLTPQRFGFTVEAKNTGKETLPMGIGWHPYFAFPSGKRAQARLRLPAAERALVNNYDDVFPTGELQKTKGTPYDFSKPGGVALGELYLDDCFVDLTRDKDGVAVAEIVDPAANYGLRIRAVSPEIKAFQVYAPPDKAFIALEPQFNWADPYSKVWKGRDTGMVVLAPGQSTSYTVELEVFEPGKKEKP